MGKKDRKERFEYPAFPVPAVGVVAISSSDRILMIKRGKPPAMGLWSVPGGSIELGETVYQAAYREVLEETGLQCKPYRICDAVDAIYRDKNGRVRFHYVILYVAASCEELIPVAGDDAVEARWLSLDDIRQLHTPGRTCMLIEKIMKMAAENRQDR